jgi:uncharacterized protein
MDLSLDDGSFLVKHARKSIENHFQGADPEIPAPMLDLMTKKLPIFVRLNVHPSKALRGSAGYTDSIMPLTNSLPEVALSAAFTDRRFPPLRKSELKTTVIEVSILTEPQLIHVEKPEQYPEQVVVGRDGIIVEKDGKKGVLLPQTATEFKWNPKSSLSHAAMTVGLSPETWCDPKAKVYRFQAQVFIEDAPNGNIVERKLLQKG